MDVTCLHGPLAGADPRIWPIWLSHVNEMLPLSHGLADPNNAIVWAQAILMALGAVAWLWLGRRRTARDAAWLMAGAWLAMGVATGLAAMRMAHYPAWIATALLAAAVADIGRRYLRDRLIPMALLAVILTPTWMTTAVGHFEALMSATTPCRWKGGQKHALCSTPQAYQRLATFPTGVVLGEIDLGPYVLATTSDGVLAAPYHRMAWGIISANQKRSLRHLGADETLDPAGWTRATCWRARAMRTSSPTPAWPATVCNGAWIAARSPPGSRPCRPPALRCRSTLSGPRADRQGLPAFQALPWAFSSPVVNVWSWSRGSRRCRECAAR